MPRTATGTDSMATAEATSAIAASSSMPLCFIRCGRSASNGRNERAGLTASASGALASWGDLSADLALTFRSDPYTNAGTCAGPRTAGRSVACPSLPDAASGLK